MQTLSKGEVYHSSKLSKVKNSYLEDYVKGQRLYYCFLFILKKYL